MRKKGIRIRPPKAVIDVPHTIITTGPGWERGATLEGEVIGLSALRDRIDNAIRMLDQYEWRG